MSRELCTRHQKPSPHRDIIAGVFSAQSSQGGDEHKEKHNAACSCLEGWRCHAVIALDDAWTFHVACPKCLLLQEYTALLRQHVCL